jgi:hypothetical protein
MFRVTLQCSIQLASGHHLNLQRVRANPHVPQISEALVEVIPPHLTFAS